MADLEDVQNYVDWHSVQRVDGMLCDMVQSVGLFGRLARYYLKDVAPFITVGLDRLRQSFDPEAKRDKRDDWISLEMLDDVGCAEYPGLEALAQASPSMRRFCWHWPRTVP